MNSSVYTDNPKILLMLNQVRGFVGGVERLMVRLAQDLSHQGWQVYGLFEKTLYADPAFDSAFTDIRVADVSEIEALIDYYQQLGVSIVFIHKCTQPSWLKHFQAAFKTALLVHDHDYYCLRSHKYFPYKRKNCQLPFNPVYCSICSGLMQKQAGKIKAINLASRWHLLHLARKCDISFVLSEYMRQNLIQNGWQKDSIRLLVPYQEVAEHEISINTGKPVLLYVGQLIRGKGVDLLLSALSLLKADFLCRIVGRGNDEDYLKSLSKELQLTQKVEFAGWAANTSVEYRQASIVVVPSRWQEPYGLVGLEAFAHGKAVVAFEVGGISQWLKHTVNGLLVRAGSIEKLAEALQNLIDKPELTAKLGQAGRQYLENQHSYEQYLQSLVRPLEELREDQEMKTQSSLLQKGSSNLKTQSDYIKIFGIKIMSISMAHALILMEDALKANLKSPLFFVNADCLNKIFIDREYYSILKESKVLFPDGIGINLAGRLLKTPVLENINGTDILPHLCELAQTGSYRIFLLGAAPGVAAKMKDELVLRYPDICICGTQNGFFDWENEANEVIETINDSKTDILLVAFGAPRQEKFISRYSAEIKAPLQIGVGGLFDFYSGRIPRAPLWMRKIGAEWIFRLIQEPKRMWKRYILGNPLFLYRVCRYGSGAIKP